MPKLARVLLIAVLSAALPLSAQSDPYGFYAEFRVWVRQQPAEVHKDPKVMLERYRAKLSSDGIDAKEIDRRIHLLETRSDFLETEFWNRYFTNPDNKSFNPEPNQLLMEMVKGRKPGRALDVGMGQGRNAIYLAQQGWDVTGIDPAERAIAVAKKAADRMGLRLTTVVTTMEDFDYGKSQWDLVLFSWVTVDAAAAGKVLPSLKPGGIVVAEGGVRFFGGVNGLLRLFEPLRVRRYEDTVATSDFFNRSSMPLVRYCGEKQ